MNIPDSEMLITVYYLMNWQSNQLETNAKQKCINICFAMFNLPLSKNIIIFLVCRNKASKLVDQFRPFFLFFVYPIILPNSNSVHYDL